MSEYKLNVFIRIEGNGMIYPGYDRGGCFEQHDYDHNNPEPVQVINKDHLVFVERPSFSEDYLPTFKRYTFDELIALNKTLSDELYWYLLHIFKEDYFNEDERGDCISAILKRVEGSVFDDVDRLIGREQLTFPFTPSMCQLGKYIPEMMTVVDFEIVDERMVGVFDNYPSIKTLRPIPQLVLRHILTKDYDKYREKFKRYFVSRNEAAEIIDNYFRLDIYYKNQDPEIVMYLDLHKLNI